jgi:hypothetical protein
MNYLMLALLVLTFPASAGKPTKDQVNDPATAVEKPVINNLNLSKSNVNRDSPLEPTEEQCATTKDEKVIAQCKQAGGADRTVHSGTSHGGDIIIKNGRPTKDQCGATTDAKVIAQCKQFRIAVSDPGGPDRSKPHN